VQERKKIKVELTKDESYRFLETLINTTNERK
jgi:ribosomal protein L5